MGAHQPGLPVRSGKDFKKGQLDPADKFLGLRDSGIAYRGVQ